MKVHKFKDREPWMVFRLGKSAGSDVKSLVVPNGVAKYRKAAESIVGSLILAEDMLTSAQAMERGHDLEPEALTAFENATGMRVKRGLVVWQSDEDPRIIVSPDGPIGRGDTEVVEVKCLLSAKHVEALYTGDFPKNTGGYEEQRLKHFIVNKKLKKHHTAFYHPDFPTPLNLFIVTKTREDLEPEIAKLEAAERKAIAEVRAIVNALTLYNPEQMKAAEKMSDELLAGIERETI